jgi:uncharacterized Zn-finger protein
MKNALDSHMLSKHISEKMYQCDICNRTFALPISLRVHLRTHTGEKPYACVVCGRVFAQLCQAKKHMETHLKLDAKKCETKLSLSASNERLDQSLPVQ